MSSPKSLTFYEHETYRFSDSEDDMNIFKALDKFQGSKGVPFYKLVHKGVKFNEFVGVLQIGNHLIEVLPKADRQISQQDQDENDEVAVRNSWRKLLIDMLKAVGVFDIKTSSSSSLKLNPNSLLELYYEIFLNEIEALIHRGLIKKYKKTEGNLTSLKGNIHFSKNIQQNLVHQERFYTKHTTYNVNHVFHQILFQAIELIRKLNRNVNLSSKITSVLMSFPDVSTIKVSEATFNKLVYNRNNEQYRNAISIARLLLLNYHPDVSRGSENVLAIMFDMNVLWEKFVVSSLRKSFYINNLNYDVTAQLSTDFWISLDSSRSRTIRPDISITNNDKIDEKLLIIDTKWKNIKKDGDVSMDILRQMYVYHEYFDADKVAIVFPGETTSMSGHFSSNAAKEIERKCALLPIPIGTEIKDLRDNLFSVIINWIKEK